MTRPTDQPTDDLMLYMGAGCGYCADVRSAASELGVVIEERDAWRDPERLAELLQARGRRTVPVLRIRREDDEDEWMGESADIIDYLNQRFGDGSARPIWQRWASHRLTVAAMWGFLLLGGLSDEPQRSWLWALACLVAGARSIVNAVRTRAWVHWGVGGAFLTGAVANGLSALGVASFEWWWVAGAVVVLAIAGAWAKARQHTRA